MPAPKMIIDPATDKSRAELIKIAKRYEIPEFVASANIDEVMDPTERSVTTYADPVNKKFACDSAASTWLSAAYFHDNINNFHPKIKEKIQERLEKFASYHGIKGEYEELVKKASDYHKDNPLPDSAYAYVYVAQDGHKERYYPMQNTTQVKAAAEWLFENRNRIPFQHRNVIGNKILTKMAAYGASIGDELTSFIEKQAGRGIPDPKELYQTIRDRALLAKSAEHRDSILKLAEAVEKTPHVALRDEELVKLACTLDTVDNALGIRNQYGSLLQRPEDVVFKVTFTKAASHFDSLCELQTGNIYDKSHFAKLSRDNLASLFGDDFVEDVCTGLNVDAEKVAAVAHTLPRPDAEMLERLLQEAGVHPTMSKSAAAFSDQDVLEKVASTYRR